VKGDKERLFLAKNLISEVEKEITLLKKMGRSL
jgi:hypothetical protein